MNSKSIRRAILPGVAALALVLSACGGQDDDSASDDGSGGASGSVAVDGSSTVYPLSSVASELLSEENPDIKVTVGESGTGGGFEVFCAGQTDISNASRPIEDDEAAACESKSIDYTEIQVATDALTVVVNKDVDCRLCDHRAAQADLGAGGRGHDHQLEPGRPELPRRGARRCSARAPTPARSTTSPT